MDSPIIQSKACMEPGNSAFLPEKLKLCNGDGENMAKDSVVTTCYTDSGPIPGLSLFQSVCLTLPNNQPMMSLLKALSLHLADRYLVTRVVQCIEYHETGATSKWSCCEETNCDKGKYNCMMSFYCHEENLF